jgi:hypothetical protein
LPGSAAKGSAILESLEESPRLKKRSERAPSQALVEFAELFAAPIPESDGCIILSKEPNPLRHASSFPGDPVGFEAFVNHVHLNDIAASAAGRPIRRDLIRIGENVIRAWSGRLREILRGREVLFYLGGLSGVTLRLHVVRKGHANWFDLEDKGFLKKEKVRIFRLTAEGLAEEI